LIVCLKKKLKFLSFAIRIHSLNEVKKYIQSSIIAGYMNYFESELFLRRFWQEE
jgi:hypothetical protein